MTQSAIGSAWTPAEFVSTTPLPASGARLEPTPAVAVCAQRSVPVAAAATPAGTPKPM
jgi:hypothetical protein